MMMLPDLDNYESIETCRINKGYGYESIEADIRGWIFKMKNPNRKEPMWKTYIITKMLRSKKFSDVYFYVYCLEENNQYMINRNTSRVLRGNLFGYPLGKKIQYNYCMFKVISRGDYDSKQTEP